MTRSARTLNLRNELAGLLAGTLLASTLIGCGAASMTSGAPTIPPLQPETLTTLLNSEIPGRVNGALVTATAPLPKEAVLLGDSAGRIFVAPFGQAPFEINLASNLTGKIMDVAASADGSVIGAVSAGGDLAFGQADGTLFVKAEMYLSAMAFDLTNTQVAFGKDRVVVFSTSSGEIVSTYDPSAGGVSADHGYGDLAFTPDERIVAAGNGADHWQRSSSSGVQLPVDCSCVVSDVALSPDGKHVGFGTPDGHLIVIDSSTGQVLADETVTTGHNDRVRAVAASDGGELFIGVSQSGQSALWDATLKQTIWRGQLTDFDIYRIGFAHSDQALMISHQVDESDSGSTWGLATEFVSLPG